MIIDVERMFSSAEETVSAIRVDRHWMCYGLEDQYQAEKVYGETRVPSGEYEVTLRDFGGFHQRYARKFPITHKGMLWIRNVPGFEHILLHIGNTDKDTAGCILVGTSYYRPSIDRYALSESKRAYKRLYPVVADALLRGEEVRVRIHGDEPA